MTEARFEEELKKFDSSLWLTRREDGWSIKGIDIHRRCYDVIALIPIGGLGMGIIHRLWELNPHKNGGSQEAFIDDVCNSTPDGSEVKKVSDDITDYICEETRRILSPKVSYSGGFIVNDYRRDLAPVAAVAEIADDKERITVAS